MRTIAALILLSTVAANAAQPKPKLCPVQVRDKVLSVDCNTVVIIAQLQAQITYLTDTKADKKLDTTRALAPKTNRGGRV